MFEARQGVGLFAQLADFSAGGAAVNRLQGRAAAGIDDTEVADVALRQVVKLARVRLDAVGAVTTSVGGGEALVVGAEFGVAVAAGQERGEVFAVDVDVGCAAATARAVEHRASPAGIHGFAAGRGCAEGLPALGESLLGAAGGAGAEQGGNQDDFQGS